MCVWVCVCVCLCVCVCVCVCVRGTRRAGVPRAFQFSPLASHRWHLSPVHASRSVMCRGCHKDAHLFFFYYGIHSLMFGGYPPTAIGYPPTAIGYPPTAIGYTATAIGYPPTAIGYTPTAIGYPPATIVGRIGHSEFFFSITAPPGDVLAAFFGRNLLRGFVSCFLVFFPLFRTLTPPTPRLPSAPFAPSGYSATAIGALPFAVDYSRGTINSGVSPCLPMGWLHSTLASS